MLIANRSTITERRIKTRLVTFQLFLHTSAAPWFDTLLYSTYGASLNRIDQPFLEEGIQMTE
jgi:hypothetical protein